MLLLLCFQEKYLKTREDAASISYEEPTKSGIGSDNVGNKLLQKMGWQEGMGLGKSNQGRTSIIQVCIVFFPKAACKFI
jgi:RNA-binding protein 5/10